MTVGSVMRLAIPLVLFARLAWAGPDWKGAEKVARDHAAAGKATVVDVSPKPDYKLGTVFWVRTKDAAGKITGHLVAVRGTTVYETVGALLKADDFLKTRAIDAAGMLILARELATLPPQLGNVITESPDTRLNPTLAFGKDDATFTLYSSRKVARPEAGAAKLYLVKATLTVASDYKVAWKTDDVELPKR